MVTASPKAPPRMICTLVFFISNNVYSTPLSLLVAEASSCFQNDDLATSYPSPVGSAAQSSICAVAPHPELRQFADFGALNEGRCAAVSESGSKTDGYSGTVGSSLS